MACFAALFKLEMGGVSVLSIVLLCFSRLESDQSPYARRRLSGHSHDAFSRLRKFVQCYQHMRIFFDLSQNSHA